MTTIQTTLTPMLSVRDPAQAVQFYKDAFGATELSLVTVPGGAMYGEMAIGDVRFEVTSEAAEHGNLGPLALGGTPVRLSLIVPDPDALAERAVAAGMPLPFSGIDCEPSASCTTTVPVAGQRNFVTVLPLHSRDRTHGVLVIGRAQPLDPVLYMAALELARRAALAVDNARLHEEQLSTVNALQASLLPTALPDVPGVRLAACYHAASTGLSVGGDFYDGFPVPDGRLAVAIGDVCGKGAEAAAVTGMTRDLLRVLMQDGASPAAACADRPPHGLAVLHRRVGDDRAHDRRDATAVVSCRTSGAGPAATRRHDEPGGHAR